MRGSSLPSIAVPSQVVVAVFVEVRIIFNYVLWDDVRENRLFALLMLPMRGVQCHLPPAPRCLQRSSKISNLERDIRVLLVYFVCEGYVHHFASVMT